MWHNLKLAVGCLLEDVKNFTASNMCDEIQELEYPCINKVHNGLEQAGLLQVLFVGRTDADLLLSVDCESSF